MANSLMPENELQELWELNGRVKATIQYIKHYEHSEKELLLNMLGDPVEEMSVEAFVENFLEDAKNDESFGNKAER